MNIHTTAPPAVGGTMDMLGRDDDAIRADLYASEGHPLAMLVRLRLEAARHVEALLAFLDATEGDIDIGDDSEPTIEAIRGAVRLCDHDGEDDEDGADHEPSLGAPEIPPTFNEYSEKYQMWLERQGDQNRWASGSDDGREVEPEHDECTGDDEPSLGRLNPNTLGEETYWRRSLRWSLDQSANQGLCDDLEEEFDGREEGHDAEEVNEDGDGAPDDEPSLGWTEDHRGIVNTMASRCDAEFQDYVLTRKRSVSLGICNVTPLGPVVLI